MVIGLICVIRVLNFAPDGSFNVVGISKDDSYDFFTDVWHGVVGYWTEVCDL